jgi:hypothetical protein
MKKPAKKFSYLRRQPESPVYYRKDNVLVNRWEGKHDKHGKMIVHSLSSINSFVNLIVFASEESMSYRETLENNLTVWNTIINSLYNENKKERFQFLGELYVAILTKMKGLNFINNGSIWNGEIEIEDLVDDAFFDFWTSFKTVLNENSTRTMESKTTELEEAGYDDCNLMIVQNEGSEKISVEKLPIKLKGYQLSGAIISETKRNNLRDMFIGRLQDGRWIKFDDLDQTTKILQPKMFHVKLVLYLNP